MDPISFVAGALAGLVGGYTVKLVMDLRSQKAMRSGPAIAKDRSVSQSGNVAGGHIAGRDVNTDGK